MVKLKNQPQVKQSEYFQYYYMLSSTVFFVKNLAIVCVAPTCVLLIILLEYNIYLMITTHVLILYTKENGKMTSKLH